ncbi:MAG: UDP-N-acetylmuramoyl-L-alanine--D-glutamate ligase, partial [Thermodesulfobacteriota bacterium]
DTLLERVKLLVLFGESKFRIEKDLGKEVETVIAFSLEEAIEKAFKDSRKGDTILFSPACSSFDMFRSYEERGRRFKEIVQNL